MNERIEQLINEAGHTTLPNFSNSIDPMFAEKFAELIVKEILQTCEDHPAWTGRMIGEEIKQHFGVEE